MTNLEILKKQAVENLNAVKLTGYEAEFVETIKDYSKKQLRNLSTKQYSLLREIANK